MTKHEALNSVRLASMALSMTQPHHTGYTVTRFRAANVALVYAQLTAATLGASSHEITMAAEWNGVSV